MKDLKFCWAILVVSLVAFCISIHFMICSSMLLWIISVLISFCWVVEMIIYTIKFSYTLSTEECSKPSKILHFSGFLSLIIGLLSAPSSLENEEYGVTATITLFCFCYSVLAIFFGDIIKFEHLKIQEMQLQVL